MKKYILYTGLLTLGILLGWLFFGTSSGHKHEGEEGSLAESSSIWTCSMHPQIRKTAPGKCPICGMNLIPLKGGESENSLVFEMSADAVRIANIETTTIGEGRLAKSQLKLSGRIKADETNASSIVAHIPGRIEKLYVSFTGENINKGQKIARIYAPKLITAQKELLEAYKFKDVNPSLYKATVKKLKYWKISQKQIDAIISSKQSQELFTIYADHSGAVLNKRVNVGDYISEGESLFDIQNLSQLWATFDVYESDLSQLQIGDNIKFTTNAYSGKIFNSRISFIDPVINSATRTASVRGSVSNTGSLLKPEMFIEGELLQIRTKNAKSDLSIPKTAVMWTGEKSVVYVKLQDTEIPSFEYREVVIGESLGSMYQVYAGLVAGEEVVTKGAFVIDASAQLNNQASMMNRKMVKVKNSKVGISDFTNETSSKFSGQLEALLNSYILLKNALVASNHDEAVKMARANLTSLNNIDMKLINGEAHLFWMGQLKIIKSNLVEVEKSKDIEEQRVSFGLLSRALISSANAFGVVHGDYLVQFCPMSSAGKGSFWISKESKILNPYYGDAMLTCGSVTDTIKKKKKFKSKMPNAMKTHNH